MPSVYDVDCSRCGISLGTYETKSQADAAMRAHERMFHGAVGKISFKTHPDPTFRKSKGRFSFY